MKTRIVALLMAMLLALGMLTACGSNDTDTGDKANVTFILVLEDESEVKYDVSVTDGATIREALYEAKLISEEQNSALFVEDIDGHVASVMEDGVTWMPCDENGEQIMGTFDEITVSDGQTVRLVYTVVPNFDD